METTLLTIILMLVVSTNAEGLCSNGDVRFEDIRIYDKHHDRIYKTPPHGDKYYVQGTPFILWDNQWSPICGHYFWSEHYGAELFCEKMGYNSGSINGNDPYDQNTIKGRGSGKKYSMDSFRIGLCRKGDTWEHCSGGCNDYQVGGACIQNPNGKCDKTQPVAIYIQCKVGKDQTSSTVKTTSCTETLPTNCEWDNWVTGECSKTCGTGTRSNTRAKLVEEADGGTCTGQAIETEECNTLECPVDCKWSEWEIGDCSVECGGGLQPRFRKKTQEALYGGSCEGEETDLVECNPDPCPVSTACPKEKSAYCSGYVYYYPQLCKDTPRNQWFLGEDGRYACRKSCGLC